MGVGGRSLGPGSGAGRASPTAAACSIPRSSSWRCPSRAGPSPATWCARPAEGRGRPRPDPGRRGRVRLERRGALLPSRRARCRAGLERLRLRRARPARLHAHQPVHDLPARLRGPPGRGARHPGPAGPTSTTGRMALAGQSFGSYFAARSAATDPRVRRPGGQPAGGGHGALHGGLGRDRCLPHDPGHPSRGRHRRPRGPDAPPDAVGDRRHLRRASGCPPSTPGATPSAATGWDRWSRPIRCPVLALVGDREGVEPLAQFDRLVAEVGGPGHRRSDSLPRMAPRPTASPTTSGSPPR